jgi:Fic family protein
MSFGKNGVPPLMTDMILTVDATLMRGATTSVGKEVSESRFRSRDQPVFSGCCYTFPNMTDHKKDSAEALKQGETDFGSSHNVEYATNLLYNVLTLHPFMNGIGRTARLLYAYGLARHGIPFATVFSDCRWAQLGTPTMRYLHTMGTHILHAALRNMIDSVPPRIAVAPGRAF